MAHRKLAELRVRMAAALAQTRAARALRNAVAVGEIISCVQHRCLGCRVLTRCQGLNPATLPGLSAGNINSPLKV